MFKHIKEGDRVIRLLGGAVRMPLRVTQVSGGLIYCGPWAFDVRTGAEIDEQLGWTVDYTGSCLIDERYT